MISIPLKFSHSWFLQANVIPPDAFAIINHRIHPLQTKDEVNIFSKNVIGINSV